MKKKVFRILREKAKEIEQETKNIKALTEEAKPKSTRKKKASK